MGSKRFSMLAVEMWLALAASGALFTAGLAHGLALREGRGGVGFVWARVSLGARLVAIAAVAGTLALVAGALGRWTPFDLRQVALSLALSTMVVYVTLACIRPTPERYPGSNPPRSIRLGVGPIVDAVALALVLAGMFVVQPGEVPLACEQPAALSDVQWVLYLVGGGGVAVAGSIGLGLLLCPLLIWKAGRVRNLRSENPCSSLATPLGDAVALALSTLGAGFVVGVWSAWQATGNMSRGDPREAWLAVAWLVTAMCGLAHSTSSGEAHGWSQDSQRWTGVLALLAAAVIFFGLFVG
jgi:hypothetical protein